MMGRPGLLAWRNAALTVAGLAAVLGGCLIVDARSNCDIESCRGPTADPWLWVDMGFGAAWLVLAAACLAAGIRVHARIRHRFPGSFPPGSRWIGARDLAGFLAIFAALAAVVQWDATGERWAPSQCDQDGTPVEDCPDYGYHGEQVQSLWMAGGSLALALVFTGVAAFAHGKVRRAPTAALPATPLGGPGDILSRQILVSAGACLGLAVGCFAASRSNGIGFAFVGVGLAALAVGGALVCLVLPRAGIGTKWTSVLLIALGAYAGVLNYATIVWSTVG